MIKQQVDIRVWREFGNAAAVGEQLPQRDAALAIGRERGQVITYRVEQVDLALLRQQVKEQEKEIRRLKKENDFLEEASAFFAASRLKSAKTKE